jgi:hypothetical protein
MATIGKASNQKSNRRDQNWNSRSIFIEGGRQHPKSLNSEGHQDSMGLCLYMAINEKISASQSSRHFIP